MTAPQDDRIPGWQFMCSYRSKQKNLETFAYNQKILNVKPEECWLDNWTEPDQLLGTFPKFPICHYKIHWITYRGWRLYMLMTGAFASIPDQEPAEQERENKEIWEAEQDAIEKSQRDAQLHHLGLGE